MEILLVIICLLFFAILTFAVGVIIAKELVKLRKSQQRERVYARKFRKNVMEILTEQRVVNQTEAVLPTSVLPQNEREEPKKDFWDDIDAIQEFLEPETNVGNFKELAQTQPLEAQRMAAIRLQELKEKRPRI